MKFLLQYCCINLIAATRAEGGLVSYCGVVFIFVVIFTFEGIQIFEVFFIFFFDNGKFFKINIYELVEDGNFFRSSCGDGLKNYFLQAQYCHIHKVQWSRSFGHSKIEKGGIQRRTKDGGLMFKLFIL